MTTIDLNADVGEGEDDLPIFPFVTSVNVACGAHAGDAETIDRSVGAAARQGLAVGAHPGYEDREHLGRRALDVPPQELERSLREQIERLALSCERHGVALRHVKPHGALYNQAAVSPELAGLIAGAVRAADPSLTLVGLAGSALVRAGAEASLRVAEEAFCDRRYRFDRTLVPRGTPGALVETPEEAAAQALAIARGEPIETADGRRLVLSADTLCLHADTPGALEFARAVRSALEGSGVAILPLAQG